MRRRVLENRSEEYETLRSLLMGEELEALKRIEERLASLEFDAYDDTTLSRKILPLFDGILLQALQAKDSRTLTLLSEHIAQVIEQSSEQHLPELSRSLRRVISPAIAQEIENNQETMVDALYPIMGGMVSKYVSQSIKEMADRINGKIEEGLTFGKYKRKLKSKVTGVSEGELLVGESTQAIISSLMAIHKESGLLVAEAHLEDHQIGDAHMVASMASAIRDFINDWIQSHQGDASEVETLSYGKASLYIESAGSVYIIAFLNAEPDREQRIRINTFFARLIKKYQRFFQNFDGDDAAKEIQEISEKMQHFLGQQTSRVTVPSRKKKKRFTSYLWTLLLMGGLGYLLYLLSGYYREYHLERLVQIKTGQEIEIRQVNGTYRFRGNVASLKAYRAVMKIAHKEIAEPIVDELHLPLDQVEGVVTDVSTRIRKDLDRDASSLKGYVETEKNKLKQQLRVQNDDVQTQINALKNDMEMQAAQAGAQQGMIQNREDNLSDAITLALENLSTLQARVKHLEKEEGVHRERIRQYEQANRTIREMVQLRSHTLATLSRVFGGMDGFNAEDGSLDFKNSRLFAPGKASVKQEARIWLDKHFQRYIALLLGDAKIKPYLRSIVIEGYTDSTGNPKRNQMLSRERAQVVRDYIVHSPWGRKYHLKEIVKARGAGSSNLIMVDGIEDKEASRRIRVKSELDTQKILNTILKEVP